MQKKESESFYPPTRTAWRNWLKKNHNKEQSVWLICYRQKSGKPSISWSDAVDEALCFGWIDSTRKSIDADSFIQFFTRRKPKSVWSKINKEKVQHLTNKGLMQPAGLAVIERAKENGSWTILDTVEELEIPAELIKAFKTHAGSKKHFSAFSKSSRKAILQWLILAKRAETRQARAAEIATLAAQNLKPKQFR